MSYIFRKLSVDSCHFRPSSFCISKFPTIRNINVFEIRENSFDHGIMHGNMCQNLWHFLCNFDVNRNKSNATLSVVAVTDELLALRIYIFFFGRGHPVVFKVLYYNKFKYLLRLTQLYVYFIIILLLATSFGLKTHHPANIYQKCKVLVHHHHHLHQVR